MSITYRYVCATELVAVYETRTIAQGPPTVCANEGSAIVAGSLAIVESPLSADDAIFHRTVNFAGATILNLAHASLVGSGTHTHAQIDTHVDNALIHRSINDAGTASTDLWSASNLTTQLAAKSAVGHTHVVANVTDYATATDARADARITLQKAQNNGLASLDAGGKVPLSQIPLDGSVIYQGTWNAATNTPALASGVGVKGYYYVTAVSGTTLLNGITDWQVSDWAIFDGTAWEKSDHSNQVLSVAGKQGAVTLVNADITDFQSGVTANTNVAAGITHRANTSNPHSTTLDQVTVATTKGDLLAHNGTNHVRKVAGSNLAILQADSTQADGLKWVSNKKFIISGRNTLKSLSTTWAVVDNFIFPGASVNSVFRILVNAQADAGVTYSARIYDATNLAVVATVTGNSANVPIIINMGTLANIPTAADVVFEVQFQVTAGLATSGAVYYSAMLEYQ